MENMKQMMPILLVVMAITIAGIVYLFQGISMQNQVPAEEAKFHALQQEYFIINKAEREAAPTGSELNQKLVDIQNYPSQLLELKLVGVGKILTGIFALLFVIGIFLFMMPIRLAQMTKRQ
jgi:Tfp pilus assembly protein PilO